MANNVIILGAGASVECGAPLMSNFLDRAEDLMLTGVVDDYSEEFKKVFSLVERLQAVYAKSELDLNNIEALFGALEMASIIKRLPGIQADQIESYRDALIRVIVKTLERSIVYPVHVLVADKPEPKDSYSFLAKLIQKISKEYNESSSIITFNYDIAIDHSLHSEGLEVEYCTSKIPNTRRLHQITKIAWIN
jgi:hypothetical protein